MMGTNGSGTASKPDILLCMSDQHGADYMGYKLPGLDTPVLDALKKTGTLFANAYTSCPLCVPARMSFMSALLPEHTQVFDNSFTLADTIPCFTHALVEAGYETVLVGRMHFTGADQRHGFTRRIAPDITPVGFAKPFRKIVEERGKTVRAFSSAGATDLVGAGASIVGEYDRMVTKAALDYLAEDHDKPQFILVGTFGPHFPYIADEARYRKYLERVEVPALFSPEDLPDAVVSHPVLSRRIKGREVDEPLAKACLAAYYANIEEMDARIGEVQRAFADYTRRSGHESVFGYLSDHGDTAGERRMYGKQTYFDKSAKIPMVFCGNGIAKDTVVETPVSLMDVGPTLLDWTGAAPLPDADGRSFAKLLQGTAQVPGEARIIVSQMVDSVDGTLYPSTMLVEGKYKYVRYHRLEAGDTLVDLEADPLEMTNLAADLPKVAEHFRDYLKTHVDFDAMARSCEKGRRCAELFKAYEQATGINDHERWKDNSPASRGILTVTAADRIETAGRW